MKITISVFAAALCIVGFVSSSFASDDTPHEMAIRELGVTIVKAYEKRKTLGEIPNLCLRENKMYSNGDVLVCDNGKHATIVLNQQEFADSLFASWDRGGGNYFVVFVPLMRTGDDFYSLMNKGAIVDDELAKAVTIARVAIGQYCRNLETERQAECEDKPGLDRYLELLRPKMADLGRYRIESGRREKQETSRILRAAKLNPRILKFMGSQAQGLK